MDILRSQAADLVVTIRTGAAQLREHRDVNARQEIAEEWKHHWRDCDARTSERCAVGSGDHAAIDAVGRARVTSTVYDSSTVTRNPSDDWKSVELE